MIFSDIRSIVSDLKIENEKTASNGILSLFDQAVVSLTNFLTGIIIGRSCTKEEFGLYLLGFSIILFVVNLQTAIISSPYMVYVHRIQDNATVFNGSTLIHQFILSFISAVFLTIFGVILLITKDQSGLLEVVWALVFSIILILFREYIRRFLFANMRMAAAFILDASVAVIQISILLFVSHLSILSAARTYWIIGLVCGIVSIIWVIVNHKEFNFRLSQIFEDFKNNWNLGKWIFVGNLLFMLSTQSYAWFLATFHGFEATGVLAAAMGVIFLANPLILGMGNFLGPKTAESFATKNPEKLRHIVAKASIFFTALMGLFCLIMLLFGDKIVEIIYGVKYAGNGFLIGILALSQLASSLTVPLNAGLITLERSDLWCKSYIFAFFITITLGLFLVESFSVLGVAFGLLAGNLVASIYRWKGFRRELKYQSINI